MAVEHIFDSAPQALCWATEVALATLEYYRGLKKPPQHELRRHVAITDTLLRACERHAHVLDARRCPRVTRHLERVSETAKEKT